jgi:hypothetical protein
MHAPRQGSASTGQAERAVPEGERPLTAHDRLDPRIFLYAPEWIADDDDLLAWTKRHHPGYVYDDERALWYRESARKARASNPARSNR